MKICKVKVLVVTWLVVSFSSGIILAEEGKKKVTGSYLGGTGSTSDPARMKMTITAEPPKPFGIEKDGNQYKKDIGGGKHLFGEGDKNGAAVGIGIKTN